MPGNECAEKRKPFILTIIENFMSLPVRKQIGSMMLILPVTFGLVFMLWASVMAAVAYGNYTGLVIFGGLFYGLTVACLMFD